MNLSFMLKALLNSVKKFFIFFFKNLIIIIIFFFLILLLGFLFFNFLKFFFFSIESFELDFYKIWLWLYPTCFIILCSFFIYNLEVFSKKEYNLILEKTNNKSFFFFKGNRTLLIKNFISACIFFNILFIIFGIFLINLYTNFEIFYNNIIINFNNLNDTLFIILNYISKLTGNNFNLLDNTAAQLSPTFLFIYLKELFFFLVLKYEAANLLLNNLTSFVVLFSKIQHHNFLYFGIENQKAFLLWYEYNYQLIDLFQIIKSQINLLIDNNSIFIAMPKFNTDSILDLYNFILLLYKCEEFIFYFSDSIKISSTFFDVLLKFDLHLVEYLNFINNYLNIWKDSNSNSLLLADNNNIIDYIPRKSFIQNFDMYIKLLICICQVVWLFTYWFFVHNKATTSKKSDLSKEIEIIFLYLLVTYFLLELVTSTDLLTLMVSLEGHTLALCVLCAAKGGLTQGEASLKYYITSAASTGFFLLGCAILYGITGSIYLKDISLNVVSLLETQQFAIDFNVFSNNTLLVNSEGQSIFLVIAGLFCFFSGFLFKIGNVPFHAWLADVYNGSKLLFVSYIAIIPKIAIVYVFIKLVTIYFYSCNLLSILLLTFGAITMLIGILGAFFQTKIKGFLAYSSIANLGLIILLAAFAKYFDITVYLNIIFIFIINYALILMQIFLSLVNCIYAVLWKSPNKNHSGELIFLSEFSGLWKINKLQALSLTVAFLTLIGIPPIIGFFVKTYIAILLLSEFYILISFFFLFCGAISTIYYLYIIKLILFNNINKNLFLVNTNTCIAIIQVFILSIQVVFFFKPIFLFLLLTF